MFINLENKDLFYFQWIEGMADAGANQYTFHYEAADDHMEMIRKVKEAGMQVTSTHLHLYFRGFSRHIFLETQLSFLKTPQINLFKNAVIRIIKITEECKLTMHIYSTVLIYWYAINS